MRGSVFSVVIVAGLGMLCEVLLFAERTDTVDTPKADFAHSVKERQRIVPLEMTQEQPAIDREIAFSAPEFSGLVESAETFQTPETFSTAISSSALMSGTVAPGDQMMPNQPQTLPQVRWTNAPARESKEKGDSNEFHDAVSNDLVIITDDAEIDVPPGATLPVAVFVSARLAEAESEYSRGQQDGTDRVAADFTNEVATVTSKDSGSNRVAIANVPDLERWQEAVSKADERFRVLLGDEIYNRELIRQHQRQH